VRPRGTILRRAVSHLDRRDPSSASCPRRGRAEESTPIARAFVYPIGDEQDSRNRRGELRGTTFRIPTSRPPRKQEPAAKNPLRRGPLQRLRRPCVRAVAAGVVDVSDANAAHQGAQSQRIKLPTIVNGKRIYTYGTRYGCPTAGARPGETGS